jgi:ribose 5-phosphate isomerase B
MRIAIGCDHVGFPLKASVIEALESEEHAVLDLGTHGPDTVDYPSMVRAVTTALAKGFVDLGVVLCESAAGGAMAANKVPAVRAVGCHDSQSAREGRERLDANVLVVGVVGMKAEDTGGLVRDWLGAAFKGQEQDTRVLEKIREIEESLRQGTRPQSAGAKAARTTVPAPAKEAARPAAPESPAPAPAPAAQAPAPPPAPPAAEEAREQAEPPRASDITPVLKFVASVKDAEVKVMATRILEFLRNRFPTAAGVPTDEGFRFAIDNEHIATVTLGKNFVQLEAGPNHVPTSRIRDVEALDFALRLPSIENALAAVKA